MNKSYVLLRMYDFLNEGKEIRINDCCGEYDLSLSTFRRYIAFLRGYCGEMYGKEIVYDPEREVYVLK